MPDLNRQVRAGDLILNHEVRRLCGGIARSTLIAWRARHGFPEPVRVCKVGRGRKAQSVEIWARPDIRKWLADNPPMTNEIKP